MQATAAIDPVTLSELHLEQILGQVCTPAMRKLASLEDAEWVYNDRLHNDRRREILGEIACVCVCGGGGKTFHPSTQDAEPCGSF